MWWAVALNAAGIVNGHKIGELWIDTLILEAPTEDSDNSAYEFGDIEYYQLVNMKNFMHRALTAMVRGPCTRACLRMPPSCRRRPRAHAHAHARWLRCVGGRCCSPARATSSSTCRA